MARSNFGFQIGSALATKYLTDSEFIRGSYVVVDTIASRDALPVDTGDGGVIINGSKCYVQANNKVYVYKNNAWTDDALATSTYLPFPNGTLSGTLQEVVAAILNFPNTSQGMAYLGGIRGACTPFGYGNVECTVTFMADGLAILSCGSSNVAPYHWQYNTAQSDYQWRSWSKVTVSATGTSTNKIDYITIDGTEYKLGGGTLTSITAGTGLTGGTITESGTIAVDTTVIATKSDLTGKENTSNKVTSLSASSTDDQYPSAKTTYTNVEAVKTIANSKSTVTASATGTSTDKVKYITIDGVEKQIGGEEYTAGTGITITDNVISNDVSPLVPAQATSTNQLADKAFVNSSVQTATANFRGNWSTWTAVPTDSSLYPEDYTGSKIPTVNDYMVVVDASGYTPSSNVISIASSTGSDISITYQGSTETKTVIGSYASYFGLLKLTGISGSMSRYQIEVLSTSPYKIIYNGTTYNPGDLIGDQFMRTNSYSLSIEFVPLVGTWRFKYTGVWATNGKSGWKNEYQVNETPMTAAQIAAINSGITAAKVATYDGYAAQIAAKSTVTVSETGTSETKAKYITVDGSEYKVSGSSTIFVDWS